MFYVYITKFFLLCSILLLSTSFNTAYAQESATENSMENQQIDRAEIRDEARRQDPIHEIYADLIEKIEKQAEIDTLLLAELNSNAYTLENPFVFVDPYGESPLTALVLFKTDTPTHISVHVQGDFANDSIDFEFSEYRTEHIIPIYGLYPNRVNHVTLIAKNQNGEEANIELAIETDVIPDANNELEIVTTQYDEENYSLGLNLLYEGWAGNAIDSHGNFRWTIPMGHTIALQYSKDEHGFFYTKGGYHEGDALVIEINPLGRILNIYHTPNGIHHDVELTMHNSIIMPTTNPNQDGSVEDSLVEIDLATGQRIHLLDYKDMLDVYRVFGEGEYRDNWLHCNAVTTHDNAVIISSKNQSLIIKNDWQGNIVWMLASPEGFVDPQRQYLLTPVNDDNENFEFPYDQHAVEVLPDYDNNPDTVDIILFDNGTRRIFIDDELQEQIRAGSAEEPYLYSRLVHYRINEREMTVEQMWQYGKYQPELFSIGRGDADLLANGNILGTFALTTVEDLLNTNLTGRTGIYEDRFYGRDFSEELTGVTLLREVNREGEVVWDGRLLSDSDVTIGYRAERMNIYTPNANDLRIGDAVGIYLPESITR